MEKKEHITNVIQTTIPHNVFPILNSTGHVIDYGFRPTALMLQMAIECAKPENFRYSTKEIFKKSNVPTSNFTKWMSHYRMITPDGSVRNFFEEFWNNHMTLAQMDVRKALLAIGREMAINQKDFRFWKEMSHITGVINPENKANPIPINLGKQDATIEEIKLAKHKLLLAHRGMGDTGSGGVVVPVAVERSGQTPGTDEL